MNPDTVNTVRVYTLKDSHETVHIIAAALRVGSPNQCVDNFHAGGTAWALEVTSGTVASEGYSANGKINSYYLPGRDICMNGFKVPNWAEVLDVTTRAAKITPLRWLGWDIAVTENGAEIIEANNGADVDLAQFLRGIKKEINSILWDEGIHL